MGAIKALGRCNLEELITRSTYYLDDQYLGQHLDQDLGEDLGQDLGQDLGHDLGQDIGQDLGSKSVN